MTRKLLGYGLGSALVVLAIACGGEVRELGDAAAGSAGSSASGSGTASGSSSVFAGGSAGSPAAIGVANICETACVVQLFSVNLVRCKLCHGFSLRSSGLDLEAPYVTARLKDLPAMHTDLPMGMTAADCPVGDKLIDSANPEASWLLKKIRGQQGNCGTVMPSTGALDSDEMACLETYVHCVAAQ
jgi:hypothetical protein